MKSSDINSNDSVSSLAEPAKKKHATDIETELLGLVKRMELYPKSTAAKEVAEMMGGSVPPSAARLFSKALKVAKFAFDQDPSCSKAILPLIEVNSAVHS